MAEDLSELQIARLKEAFAAAEAEGNGQESSPHAALLPNFASRRFR
jgi:hypothetical protein